MAAGSFALAAVLLAWAGTGRTQQTDQLLACSTHFQAHADWMCGLGGPDVAIELMENCTEIIWAAPRPLCMEDARAKWPGR